MDKNDIIAYNTEEEAAALCLRYVDLEERILGWNSPKIRTLMMQEGSFEVKKQEDNQVGCLFVWLFGCLVVWLFGCLVVCILVFWYFGIFLFVVLLLISLIFF